MTTLVTLEARRTGYGLRQAVRERDATFDPPRRNPD